MQRTTSYAVMKYEGSHRGEMRELKNMHMSTRSNIQINHSATFQYKTQTGRLESLMQIKIIQIRSIIGVMCMHVLHLMIQISSDEWISSAQTKVRYSAICGIKTDWLVKWANGKVCVTPSFQQNLIAVYYGDSYLTDS